MGKNTSMLIDDFTKLIEQVSDVKDNKELFKKIEELLKRLTNSDFASLFIFDAVQHTLYTEKEMQIVLPMLEAEGCISKVFFKKEPAIHNYIASDKDYMPSYDNPLQHKLKSQMLMPIVRNDQFMGIVRVSRGIKGNTNQYTKRDLELLLSIESYLIKIIRTINSNTKLSLSKESTEKIHNKIVDIYDENHEHDGEDTLLFLSNAVHDIRTPANSLYGFLELIEEKIKDERIKEFIVNAKESASLINTLTDSILASTKNKYESKISKDKIVNAIHFLSNITNIFTSQMIEKNINYFVMICPELPKEIKIDTIKVKRILINLIGNAYKFTPKNSRIDIFISYDKSTHLMTISVKDEGIGIEEEDQKKLFKAFSQATDNTQLEHGGTGLGLFISAKYVSDLGGKLELESRIDEGSNFYFTIPLDIIDNTESYPKVYDLEKKIVILTDNLVCRDANYLCSYIVTLGMPKEKIVISNKIEDGTTHLICFEHKMSNEILSFLESTNIKILFIEETLFSLIDNEQIKHFPIVSENMYYGDAIHQLIYSGKKIKVLVVDDNKINVTLLSAMLETEYVDIVSCVNAKKSLKYLEDAVDSNEGFDILFLDKHMPDMNGTELLDRFRLYEQSHQAKPIYAVSISGDPDTTEEEKNLFEAFVKKPFNKKEIREVISSVKNKV